MQTKHSSPVSPNAPLNLSPGPPPKIHVGPKPRPGGPAVSWKSRGQELTRQGPPGFIRADFTGQFTKFELHVEEGGQVSIIPINRATIRVGGTDGAMHAIDIARDGNEMVWHLDGLDLVPGASSLSHDGLPPEFFGDYQGITGILLGNPATVCLVLD